MFRFIATIVLHFFAALYFLCRMKLANRAEDKTKEQRWRIGRKVVKGIAWRSGVRIHTYGEENLPEKDGFMMLPNHQGRFDGLAITCASERPLSFVIDAARSDIILESDFMALTEHIPIKLDDPRDCLEGIRSMSERIDQGDNFCIFPEDGYERNHNTLQPFKTGVFHFLRRNQCPLVPVCIYDSWRVYNYERIQDAFKLVHVHVHYLTPILPDEYNGLTKAEVAELVKSRIQTKLDELNSLYKGKKSLKNQ